MTTKQMLSAAERFRAELNSYISQDTLSAIRELYPNLDGNQDTDVASDLYLLRDAVHSIETGFFVLQRRFEREL